MHVADLGTFPCLFFFQQPVTIQIHHKTLKECHKTVSMYLSNFSEYFKMRKEQNAREDWINIKWKPGTIPHTLQEYSVSCGVFVMQVMGEKRCT